MDHTKTLQLSILAVVATWADDAHRPDVAVMESDGLVARVRYADAAAHAARVSADVESLRSPAGFACIESWSSDPISVHLRYARAPIVEAPRPIAPAPVPASAHRRR
jgi:hypothetical protein